MQTQYALRIQRDFSDMNFFFFSDVWLDQADTLRGLQKIFDNCIENNFIPKVIVFCGNFTSSGIAQGNSRDIQRYQGQYFSSTNYPRLPGLGHPTVTDKIIQSVLTQANSFPILEGFDSLADLIASYTLITRRTHFVFVPGPLDLTINSVLPRKPLLSSFTARLRAKIPKVHLASNPCRLKFFGQEIVVFREDVMARMLRNLVGVKPDARNEDLKRYVCVASCEFFYLLPRLSGGLLTLSLFFKKKNKLVQSILDQSHLSPFTTHIQPILAEYDHAMRLYPLPTCVRA